MDSDKLEQICDDAGRPGAQAFKFAVRKVGLQISDVEAKAFVAQQARFCISSDCKIVEKGARTRGGKWI